MRIHARDIAVGPPLFSTAFGIAGYAGAWRLAGRRWESDVGDILALTAAALAMLLAAAWIAQLAHRERSLWTDLRDPLLGPSVPGLPLAGMLLSVTLLTSSENLARPLIKIFAVMTFAVGVAIVVGWIHPRLPLRRYHPGFYLPTAGVALLTAQCITNVEWIGLAQVLFFGGVAAWLILATVTTIRLARFPLPVAVRPVLAIEIAAPSLASNTYLVVYHRFDACALALTAVTVLMGITQVALIHYFRRAPFGAAWWTFAFSWATTTALAVRWINHEQPDRATFWCAAALIAGTAVLAVLAIATYAAARRGEFFAARRPCP